MARAFGVGRGYTDREQEDKALAADYSVDTWNNGIVRIEMPTGQIGVVQLVLSGTLMGLGRSQGLKWHTRAAYRQKVVLVYCLKLNWEPRKPVEASSKAVLIPPSPICHLW